MWWQDIREEHRETAKELEEHCDWTWAASQNVNDVIYYKLFLLCKNVANDTVLKANQTRFLLSPTPEIDVIWHEHMLRPILYVNMCRILNKDKPVDEQIIGHDPDFAQDEVGVKRRRIDTLADYVEFVTKKNRHLSLPTPVAAPPVQIIPPAAPQPSSDSDQYIQFTVRDSTGSSNELIFKVKLSTKMDKIISTYSQRKGKPISRFYLSFKGVRVKPTDTPTSLGLTDYDVLEYIIQHLPVTTPTSTRTPTPEPLVIRVNQYDSNNKLWSIPYTIKSNQTFEAIFTRIKLGIYTPDGYFLFNGNRVYSYNTPDSLGMVHDDALDYIVKD